MRAGRAVALALALASGAPAEEPRRNDSAGALRAKIDEIIATTPRWTDSDFDLCGKKRPQKLRELYEEPNSYSAEAEALILDAKAPPEVRCYALFAMQCMPLGYRLGLIEALSREDSDVGRSLLLQEIFPPFEWSVQLALASDDPRARDSLSRVRASLAAREPTGRGVDAAIVESIDFLLTGEAGR